VIVLDTHVWIWWVNGDHHLMRPGWLTQIESADTVAVSVISAFEVAWLEKHGRIQLLMPRDDWFRQALEESGVQLLPLTTEVVSRAVDLPEHHKDPQDRLILATALCHQAGLMSADGKFPLYTELAHLLIG
jgi:PIN domain nuclease of toxin-antitoxin system